MKNVSVILCVYMLLIIGSCKKEPNLTAGTLDYSIPTLSYPIASFASVTRFFPFGDTIMCHPANPGFQIILTDTTSRLISACSGIVASITPNSNGSNSILIKYKKNSVYSFLYSGIGLVQVSINDSVPGGAILGVIAHNCIIGFSVIKNNNQVLCPESIGSQDFNTSIEVAISRNNVVSPEDSIALPCVGDSLPYTP